MSKISKKQIKDDAIDSSKVLDESLTTDDVKNGTLLDEDISDNAGIQLKKLDTTGANDGDCIVLQSGQWTSGSLNAVTSHAALSGLSDSDVHPASSITNTPAGNIVATDAQQAINELDTKKANDADISLVGKSNDYTDLSNTPFIPENHSDLTLDDGTNPHGTTKSDVGLSNADNTSDANKPVSTAQQTALDLKANLANPTFTGTVGGITKAMVGLANADNTSDTNKPISTAQQTALDLKANLASPTFTGTVSGIDKTMVGLSNIDNTSDANKPVSTAQQTALNLKANIASPTFTGTVGGITKAMVGLANADNTSDANKPVSTAQQTALNLKANIASPTFTGTVGGITKAMVGLGNVDNTSDANKPVSDATQTALNAKENAFTKNTAFNKNFGSSIQTVGTTNDQGSGENVARDNHTHNHGNQTNESHHALVTQALNGFMSKEDKAKLDGLHLGDMIGLACEGSGAFILSATEFETVPLVTTTFENRPEYVDRNSNQIRIKTTGLYLVVYKMNMIQAAQTSTYEAQLLLNGTTVMDGSSSRNTNYNGEHCPTSVTTLQYLTANDYFELQALRVTANNLTAVTPPHIVVVKMEGYKGEKGDPGPAISYDTATDTTTRTNTARSYNAISIFQTYPARNIVPSGTYRVTFKVKYTVAANNNTFYIALHKNGTLIPSTEQIWRVNVAGTGYRYQYMNYSVETYVNNTTTFDLRAYSASTTITIYESEILLERLS